MKHKTQLIVALDVDSLKKARRLVTLLYPTVKIFKVGSQLFTAAGPEVIHWIRKKGARVFLDLKFYDIPNSVANAVSQAVSLRVLMLDVHLAGGKEMLRAAVRAANHQARRLRIKKPLVLGVTVLTSEKPTQAVKKTVLQQARLAKQCALEGVIASAQEARRLRANLGARFIIVTPGIRMPGSAGSDQRRIATPSGAAHSGSDYLVVGRPIIKAKEPLKAAQAVIEDLRSNEHIAYEGDSRHKL